MRPLIRRAPDGRPYGVPSAPQHRGPESNPQPASDTASGAEAHTRSDPTPRRLSKLTAEDVCAIRADYAAGRWSQSDLAYIHGVSQHTIHRVVTGQVHTESTPEQQES